jgi:glutamate 5-kinase
LDTPVTNLDNPRAAFGAVRRVVVKIGSRSIVGAAGDPDGRYRFVADQVFALRERGIEVVLVSSGAVALGAAVLGMTGRPRAMPQLQAAASVGQPRLMVAYEAAFGRHNLKVAQVLLTHAEMADRKRYLNARHAIDALLELGAVPIINENDAVSTEEIEFGDNDQLASLVASLVAADLLVLLTDVDGVLDANGVRLSVAREAGDAERHVWADHDPMSLGGMGSKIGAARRALARGVPVVIAPARRDGVLKSLIDGEDVGTLFLPAGATLASRDYWIAHTLKIRGSLTVDAGAVRALTERNSSLLPAGVVASEGDYRAGDAIRIRSADGRELARGLVRYDSRDVERLYGARSDQILVRLGHYLGDEIVHRDDLVML